VGRPLFFGVALKLAMLPVAELQSVRALSCGSAASALITWLRKVCDSGLVHASDEPEPARCCKLDSKGPEHVAWRCAASCGARVMC
jgi:hypothetical protein